MEADSRKRRSETSGLRGDPQIAGKCQAEARPGSDPVDGSKRGNGKRSQAGYYPFPLMDKGLQVLWVSAPQESNVAAATKCPPRPGENEDSRTIGCHLNRREQVLAHGAREGVQGVGAIQRNRCDCIVYLEVDVLPPHGRGVL